MSRVFTALMIAMYQCGQPAPPSARGVFMFCTLPGSARQDASGWSIIKLQHRQHADIGWQGRPRLDPQSLQHMAEAKSYTGPRS
jgi:hypothetical protein